MPNRRSLGRQFPPRPRPLVQNRSPSSPQNDASENQSTTNDVEDFLPLDSASSGNVATAVAMSKITFEIFFLIYSLSALFAQYLYIYRTVWWYPPLLPPSNTTVNFHLIDNNLTVFLILLFLKRFLCCLFWHYLRPASETGMLVILWALLCVAIFGVWLFEIARNAISLLDRFQSYKVMFLFYPVILWIFLNSFFENGWFRQMFGYIYKKNTKSRSQLLLKVIDRSDALDQQKLSAQYDDPDQVREDIKQLCQDFNSKLCEVIFSSMVCSYYAGLVPMFFTESHHFYNFSWSLQHTALVLLNSFFILAWYLMPPRYLQSLHSFALLLGGYTDVDKNSDLKDGDSQVVQDWSPNKVFPFGALIKYKSKTFVAFGKRNVALPLETSHQRFSCLFYTPLRALNCFLIFYFTVIVYQVHVVISSSYWDHVIASSLLQFFSYYVLFMLLRDRVTLGLHYKTRN